MVDAPCSLPKNLTDDFEQVAEVEIGDYDVAAAPDEFVEAAEGHSLDFLLAVLGVEQLDDVVSDFVGIGEHVAGYFPD